MKAAIVTGGTGGHIYPALALAQEMQQEDPATEFLFFGNEDRMEAQLIPQQGFAFYGLKTNGLTGSLFNKGKAVARMFAARKEARKALKDFAPDVVIGFGGYVSAPVMMAAHDLHIPALMHEQNSIAGKANLFASRYAQGIAVCYPQAAQQFPGKDVRLLGNPRASAAVRPVDKSYFDSFGFDPDKAVVLITMGSLGSSSVNQLLKEALKNPVDGVQFLFVCGKDNEQDLRLFEGRPDIVTVPYAKTLELYPWISGIICRAGATTMAEITAAHVPSILIPSPYVANNHQLHNAQALAQAGGAVVLEEKEFKENPALLRQYVQESFLDPNRRESISKAAGTLAFPNAAKAIADWAKEISCH
jgi:UDP-N-acetylglucosamine--N-acetylmuramyl-(pentapeptide) pyrophosphoryl-undecaprenol N-acetylglucosamine transferase